MASYSAVIDLRVDGLQGLKQLEDRLNVVDSLTKRIKPIPSLFDKRGAKDLVDAKNNLADLVKQYADGNTRVAKFSSSIAGLNTQLQTFKQVAANARVGSEEFTNSLKAAERASNKLLSAELGRLSALQQAYTRQGAGGLSAEEQGPSGMVNNVLALRKQLPGSISGLQTYAAELERVFNLVEAGSVDYRALQREIANTNRQLAIASGMGAVQGPALPAGFTEAGPKKTRGPASALGAKPRTGLAAPGIADALIGGSFPLLFGGGPGATLGGFAGGLAGGAMGGPMGMALSLALSAVGQQVEQLVKKFADLGEAIRRLNVDAVRDSYIFVNRELDNTIRKLIQAGEYEKARSLLLQETARQTGASAEQITASNQAVNRLQGSWAEVTRSVGALISIIATPLINHISIALKVVSLIAGAVTRLISGTRWLTDGLGSWLLKLTGLKDVYDYIVDRLPFISEEQEKIRAQADAQIESAAKELQYKQQLLSVDAQRLEGSNRMAQQSKINADYQKAALTVNRDLEEEIKGILEQSTDLTDEQVTQKLFQARAAAQHKMEEAEITAEKAKQKLLDDEAIAKLQMAGDLQQAQAKYNQTLLSSESQRLQIAIERLQQEQQFSMSLNQQTGYINHIANLRKQQAQAEYQASVAASQAAVQRAANELAVTQEKYKQNNADIEQLQNAQLNLQNAQIQARVETEIAGLKLEQLNYTTDIERAQAVVNAYAEEHARINAETTREIEKQTNAINNRATVLNAISQATQTINNIEIQSLERELERTTNTKRRKEIIEEIYKLEIENARVQLEATRANIQAELARADAAYRTVQLKYEELKAVVAIAQAEGVVTRAHFDALRAQESALRIAKDNLNTAGQVAKWQWKAADAVFKAAVDAAKLKKETTGAAQAAGNFAGNMERAAGAMGGISKAATALGAGGAGTPFAAMGGAGAIQDPGLKAQAEKIWKDAERFAATKGIASIQADILQRARDAIARIAFRDYVLQQKAAGAPAISTETPAAPLTKTPSTAPIPLTAPLATGLSRQPGGGPGTAIIDSFPSTINLQTGPVIQQNNGEKYVSLKDLEQILQDFAATIFENSRTSGGRRYQGVS